jgi:hypothetical protein
MNIIAFNTGRFYTDKGQRIAATQLDDGSVAFCDIDRGIDCVTIGDCNLTQSDVMRAYDHNAYTAGRWYNNDALTDDTKIALKAAARAVPSI